jgi:hypothetical protein
MSVTNCVPGASAIQRVPPGLRLESNHATVVERLTALDAPERARVSRSIAGLHTLRKEARVMTADGQADGRLEVRDERPAE